MDALAGAGPVNDLRRAVLAHARGAAADAQGLFTLTVPTGGGKTLTSLGFALDHALAHGLRRLIYVIPYTSIVEQTADVFREVLGEDAVLEHHSAADWDGEDETEAEQRRVSGASWDVPVVVTTAVQFFESLHAARKKRCRKLHSLARSVIVLDEAQTMPLRFLRPCLAALSELMEGYGATVVLSTATQPALTGRRLSGPRRWRRARDRARSCGAVRALRRVKVRDVGAWTTRRWRRGCAGRLGRCPSLTTGCRRGDCSTRCGGGCRASVDADDAGAPAGGAGGGARRLKAAPPVRLVSTSLIEAGVDVDFPLVLRAAAGIDRLRRRRGGATARGGWTGEVEVFRSEHPAPPAVEQFAEIGRGFLPGA